MKKLGIVFALPMIGCMSLPQPVAERTGEPLSVRERTQTEYVTEKVKVGEIEHKTTSGETYAKSDVYANQTRAVEYQVWSGYQGEQKVSDDDFYRIANDSQAAGDVKKSRETGITLTYVGLGVLAAGIAGVAGGYAINASQDPMQPSATGTYVLAGGGLVAAAGAILTYIGYAKAKREHPLDQQRAEASAIRYNRSLVGPRVTTTTAAVSP